MTLTLAGHIDAIGKIHPGTVKRVLIDRMEGFDAIGRTEADAPDIDGSVRLPECVLAPGTVVDAKIVAADVMELVAQPVGSEE